MELKIKPTPPESPIQPHNIWFVLDPPSHWPRPGRHEGELAGTCSALVLLLHRFCVCFVLMGQTVSMSVCVWSATLQCRCYKAPVSSETAKRLHHSQGSGGVERSPHGIKPSVQPGEGSQWERVRSTGGWRGGGRVIRSSCSLHCTCFLC